MLLLANANTYFSTHNERIRRVHVAQGLSVLPSKAGSRYDTRACVASRRVVSLCHIVNWQITMQCDAGRCDARRDSSFISASLALRPTNLDFGKKAHESTKGVI